MPPDKAQLDTIECYLRTIVSADKTQELMEQAKQLDEDRATQMIYLFEQRSNPKLADVERLLKKGE